MTVEWTSTHVADIDIEPMIKTAREMRDTLPDLDIEYMVDDIIDNEISGYDDDIYYSWNDEAQEQVKQAILARMGGQQLHMNI